MRESKQERLAGKDWKLGSASEFLGLTPEEDAYIELRLKLADGLRKRRKSHGVTQENLAKSLKFSQSRVAKMDAGEPPTFWTPAHRRKRSERRKPAFYFIHPSPLQLVVRGQPTSQS